MTTSDPPSLGVLRTERGLPPGKVPPLWPAPFMLNPATFNFPVIAEYIEGGWVDRVFRGDPELVPSYIAAARRLVERGAVVITASCGFSIRYQQAVAAAVNVPVVLSSLLLLPTLIRQFPAGKIAVLTADSQAFGNDMFGIEDPRERERIVVGGIEGGTLWRNELLRPPPPTDPSEIEDDVVACVERVRAAHPDVKAYLLECTGFPLVAPTVRRMTGAPTFDINTLCRMAIGSVA